MNSASLPNFSIKISNHSKMPHRFRLAIHPSVVWPTEDTYGYFGEKNINQVISEVSAGIPLLPTPSVQYSTLYFIYNFIPLLPHTVMHTPVSYCHLSPEHPKSPSGFTTSLFCSQIVYGYI